MTTDKSKWWQNWVVYGIIGLSVLIGPYVCGYLLLGDYTPSGVTPGLDGLIRVYDRRFGSEALGIIFGPLGWFEANIRGVQIRIWNPSGADFYEPSW